MDQEREKELRAWARKPEFKRLQTVLADKARLLQERALQEHRNATDGNAYDLKSSASMKEADLYLNTVDVLDAIVAQAEPFQVVKLKP